jgi:hypothetical protein
MSLSKLLPSIVQNRGQAVSFCYPNRAAQIARVMVRKRSDKETLIAKAAGLITRNQLILSVMTSATLAVHPMGT